MTTKIWRVVGAIVLLSAIAGLVAFGRSRGIIVGISTVVLLSILWLLAFLRNRSRWQLRRSLKADHVGAIDVSFLFHGRRAKGVLAWTQIGVELLALPPDSQPELVRSVSWSSQVRVELTSPSGISIGSESKREIDVEVDGPLGGVLIGAQLAARDAALALNESLASSATWGAAPR